MKAMQGRDGAVVEGRAAAHREPTVQRRGKPTGMGESGMVPSSPRMQAFQAMQAMADARMHAPTMQRVAIDEEESPLQGRFRPDAKASPTAQRAEAAEPTPHRTGLPDALKQGIEALSGLSMDGVRVHYGSSRPAQLQAHAFAQGRDIHIAPGQERHLPHEAWHVVQQAQGRVKPTMQLQGGIPANDDASLEREADVMGGRAQGPLALVGNPARLDRGDAVTKFVQPRGLQVVTTTQQGTNGSGFVTSSRPLLTDSLQRAYTGRSTPTLFGIGPFQAVLGDRRLPSGLLYSPDGGDAAVGRGPRGATAANEPPVGRSGAGTTSPGRFPQHAESHGRPSRVGLQDPSRADAESPSSLSVNHFRAGNDAFQPSPRHQIAWLAGRDICATPQARFSPNSDNVAPSIRGSAVQLTTNGKEASMDEVDEIIGLLRQDEKELEVLRRFGSNWSNARNALAYKKESESKNQYEEKLTLMLKLIGYREKKVNNIVSDTQKWFKGKEGYNLKHQAPGSSTPTSDYDITFAVPEAAWLEFHAVEKFNSLFMKTFECSSGMLFDTNVYTTGFMPSKDGSEIKPTNYPDKIWLGPGQDKASYWDSLELGKSAKHVTQLALSFLPILQYLGPDQRWEKFKQASKESLKTYLNRELKAEEEAGSLTTLTERAERDLEEVFSKTKILYTETSNALDGEKALISGANNVSIGDEDDDRQHTEAMAKDSLYVKYLQTASQALEKLHRNAREISQCKEVQRDELKKLYIQRATLITEFEIEQGKALVFANEAYYSGGASVHVVGQMQGKWDIRLGRQQKMQSLLMNVGYKLQHFEHALKGGLGRASFGTAKYGARIHDIVDQDKIVESQVGGKILNKDVQVLKLKGNPDKTPTDKESEAEKLIRGEDSQNDGDSFKKQQEEAYLKIAQESLGPYFLSKYKFNKQKNGKYSERPFWISPAKEQTVSRDSSRSLAGL